MFLQYPSLQPWIERSSAGWLSPSGAGIIFVSCVGKRGRREGSRCAAATCELSRSSFLSVGLFFVAGIRPRPAAFYLFFLFPLQLAGELPHSPLPLLPGEEGKAASSLSITCGGFQSSDGY